MAESEYRFVNVESFDILVTGVLTSFGWRMADGAPLDRWDGMSAAGATRQVLANMGAFTTRQPGSIARETTSGGKALARAALQRTQQL